MLTIDSPEFDSEITLRDAYRGMDRFLSEHLARGEVSTVELIAYAGLCADGSSGDPAALYDFLGAVARVASPTIREYQLRFPEPPVMADRGAVEVHVVLPDGSERGCFFMTPAALAAAGDWVPGTRVPMHWGETHLFVIARYSEEIVQAVLAEVARAGELWRRTRPCS